MNTVHVVPTQDLVSHDTLTPHCVCIPHLEHVPNPGQPDGWVAVHHSLDGREQHEG